MRLFAGTVCSFLLFAGLASADVINYQGRLSINGSPYTGVSRFKFALIGGSGVVVWSSQEIALGVNNGVYAVRLGDSQQAPPISPAVLHQDMPLKLRIWLDRGEKGWVRVGDDVPVTSETPAPSATSGDVNAAILAELRDIHALLAGQQKAAPTADPPQIVTVSIADAPSLGKTDAPLVLVEFTDFQCPFCIKFQDEVFFLLKTNFVDTGKLRVVSRNLPLPFHNFANPAARAAICAEAQGKFWPMRDKLFAAGHALSLEAINQAGLDVGLNSALLAACATNQATTAALLKDGQEAKAAAIDATPSFVLGRAVAGKVTGLKIIGVQPYASFATEINQMLAPGGAQ